jgi:HAE1 family hydrophobic/amphiphilic exporter-1
MFAFTASDQPITVIRLSSDLDLTDQCDSSRNTSSGRSSGSKVARVDLQGVRPREVRVLVDPTRIAAYGVDVRELRDLLESANFSVSAGEITERGSRFIVRPLGEFNTLDDVRSLMIKGGVRVSDVATVELVAPELDIGRRMDGRPAVGIDVYKSTQANVVDVADRVMRRSTAARKLPQLQGIQILVISNQAESIRSSLAEPRGGTDRRGLRS